MQDGSLCASSWTLAETTSSNEHWIQHRRPIVSVLAPVDQTMPTSLLIDQRRDLLSLGSSEGRRKSLPEVTSRRLVVLVELYPTSPRLALLMPGSPTTSDT